MNKGLIIKVLVILLIIGSIMTCAEKVKRNSIPKEYKAGNYSKTIEKIEKISDKELNAIELYISGNINDAIQPKVDAYNKVITSEEEASEFKEKLGESAYDELIAFGLEVTAEQERLARQRELEERQQILTNSIVGTWVVSKTELPPVATNLGITASDYKGLTFKLYENGFFETFFNGGNGKWNLDGEDINLKFHNGVTSSAYMSDGYLVVTSHEEGFGESTFYFTKR